MYFRYISEYTSTYLNMYQYSINLKIYWSEYPSIYPFHLFIYFLIFCLFTATPAAYGSSQARGRTGAVAAAYTAATAMWYQSHVCDLHHSSWQWGIFNPLSEARDRTHVLLHTAEPQWELPTFYFISTTFFWGGGTPKACEVARLGIKPVPQLEPKLQRQRCWILNLLSHMGTLLQLCFSTDTEKRKWKLKMGKKILPRVTWKFSSRTLFPGVSNAGEFFLPNNVFFLFFFFFFWSFVLLGLYTWGTCRFPG